MMDTYSFSGSSAAHKLCVWVAVIPRATRTQRLRTKHRGACLPTHVASVFVEWAADGGHGWHSAGLTSRMLTSCTAPARIYLTNRPLATANCALMTCSGGSKSAGSGTAAPLVGSPRSIAIASKSQIARQKRIFSALCSNLQKSRKVMKNASSSRARSSSEDRAKGTSDAAGANDIAAAAIAAPGRAGSDCCNRARFDHAIHSSGRLCSGPLRL